MSYHHPRWAPNRFSLTFLELPPTCSPGRLVSIFPSLKLFVLGYICIPYIQWNSDRGFLKLSLIKSFDWEYLILIPLPSSSARRSTGVPSISMPTNYLELRGHGFKLWVDKIGLGSESGWPWNWSAGFIAHQILKSSTHPWSPDRSERSVCLS